MISYDGWVTARTHDLFAATAGLIAIVWTPLPQVTLGTAVVAAGALFLGGMAPDLDEPGAQFWQRIPTGAGTIIGKVVAPIFGSHRFVSHSLAGLYVLRWVVEKLLAWSSGFLLVDQMIVINAFVLGMVSHLVADGLTREGVPLLWPLPFKFGIPPFKRLRMSTGGWMERTVFVSLVAFNIWLIRNNYHAVLDFTRSLV